MSRRPRRRRCIECNSLYSRLGTAIRCQECQLVARGDPVALRAWWLERFSFDELVEIGEALWPELADRPVLTIAA